MSSTWPLASFLQHPRATWGTSPGSIGICLPWQHLMGNFDYKPPSFVYGESLQAHWISDNHPCPGNPLQVPPYCKDRHVDVIPPLKNCVIIIYEEILEEKEISQLENSSARWVSGQGQSKVGMYSFSSGWDKGALICLFSLVLIPSGGFGYLATVIQRPQISQVKSTFSIIASLFPFFGLLPAHLLLPAFPTPPLSPPMSLLLPK